MDPAHGGFLPKSRAGSPLSCKWRRWPQPPASCREAIPGWDPSAGAVPRALFWACSCTYALGHLLADKPAKKCTGSGYARRFMSAGAGKVERQWFVPGGTCLLLSCDEPSPVGKQRSVPLCHALASRQKCIFTGSL